MGSRAVCLMLFAALSLPAVAGPRWADACNRPPPPTLAAPKPNHTLVLIIDDLGHQWGNGMAMVNLPGKVNLAVLPHTPHASRLAKAGFAAGKEIMLHAPMSNLDHLPLGRGGLTPGLSRQEFDQTIATALDAIPHVRGVNNHMGSELTQMPLQMGWLMQTLVRRNLYFVDSRTSAATVAADTASAYSVPNLSRSVFLDNERSSPAIGQRFDRLLQLAEERGLAIGIGHSYPETAAFLRRALPALKCRGIRLAFVSEVLGEELRQRDDPVEHAADSPSEPHLYTPLSQIGLGLGDGVFAKVKDTGGEHRIGTTQEDAVDQVVEGTYSP